MKKDTLKDILYGSICEMTRNRELYYRSSVGSKYCHWTEQGREDLFELLEEYTKKMIDVEQEIDEARAKQMTFETLKTP